MSTEVSDWIGFLHWAISNPEKGALTLVLLAGAWRWLREFKKEIKGDAQQDSFTETLLKENKELRLENKELIHELREERSKRNMKGEGKP